MSFSPGRFDFGACNGGIVKKFPTFTATGGYDVDAFKTVLQNTAEEKGKAIVLLNFPNNPSGTHLPADEVLAFVDSVPERITIVVDEAYAEFVTAADYRSLAPEAASRPNLIVTRTFSKVYALASLRVGYAITHPSTVAEMRRAQAPFTVTQVGQAGAAASLARRDLLMARVEENARGRRLLLDALDDRGAERADSQANFVWFRSKAVDPATDYINQGTIIRTFGDEWVRVTVGTDEENRRFIEALDAVG